MCVLKKKSLLIYPCFLIFITHVASQTSDGCTVPNLPPHSSYDYSDSEIKSGIKVPTKTKLRIFCHPNYKIIGDNEIICFNRTWSSDFGRCLRTCRSLQSTQTLYVRCFYENRKLPDCLEPVQSTLAQFECNPFHKLIGSDKIYCKDGSWDHPMPTCTPNCGKKLLDSQLLIVNGTTAKKYDHPWQVAVYRSEEKKFICVGTLIDSKVILTAASCFKLNKENYIIAAGKHFRQYDHPSDHEAQFRKIKEVYRHEKYRGKLNNYEANIAVVVTEPFILSAKIAPVCLDWTHSYDKEFSNSQGTVTGWGYINNEKLADELQELSVQKIEDCSSLVRHKRFLISDKFCAGRNGTAIGLGDMGNGLVFKVNGLHYLGGILALCAKIKKTCVSGWAIYTNTSQYINFIQNRMQKVNFSEDNSQTGVIVYESCPPLESKAFMEVTCLYLNGTIGNCLNAKHGDMATFKCIPSFVLEPPEKNYRICLNGVWNGRDLTCVPECGVRPVQAQTLIIGGEVAEIASIPWQAAIYKLKDGNRWKFTCGATMIHKKVFLTAAHCVTSLSDYSLIPKNLFKIAVAKHFRNFTDKRDTEAQISALKEVFVPRQYQGYIQNYFGDIAVLVTEKEFTLGHYVRPICVDWEGTYQLQHLVTGIIAGWGLTEDGELSEQLKILEVPYIGREQCKKVLDSDFVPYLTFDKMCSGFLNQSKSACQGDSGSGLVFKKDGKHYIIGVVSLAPQAPEGGCDIQQYTLYTEVSFYVNSFIKTRIPKSGFH